jgi:aspartokinase
MPVVPAAETVHFEKDRGVTEVEVTRGIAHVTVRFNPESVAQDRLTALKRFAEANVPVFLVKLLPTGISFALRPAQVETGTALLTQLKAEMGIEYALRDDLGLVTTRAGAMRDLSGIMATIYETLVAEGVMVRQTGDAYNAVHCLVPGELSDRAADALMKRLIADR